MKKVKKFFKEIWNHFWISREDYKEVLVKAHAQVKSDMGELYNSDIGRVKKQMEGFNDELYLNVAFVFGVLFPTVYLRYKSWLETYERFNENGTKTLKEVQFYNTAIFYKKKQIKYALYKITGSKSFLKQEKI